ncbi:MAG TPA: hypothetical protein VMH81_31415 [Bryobacteraceae bacterium]|nr:hypothetical protein [Bryobacteraceae bacterium]
MRQAFFCLAVLTTAALQLQAAESIAGTVTDFKVSSLEIGVKTDNGEAIFFKVGPLTDVVQVPPGERDLSKAKPAKVTDLARGDRILVSFVSGLTEARRILWISATDIEDRNAAERLDWQQRGASGTVASVQGNQIQLEIRSPQGMEMATVVVTPKTVIRRYSPDSVRFIDATPSSISEISKGDQVRCRGDRSEDRKRMTADDVVFGTFLSKMGPIESVDAAEGIVRIHDLTTQMPLTIRVTAQSQVKMLPDIKMMFAAFLRSGSPDAHAAPPREGGFDFAKMIGELPAGKIDDLKTGSTVIVTSTAGVRRDEVTAILFLANADGLIQMARQGKGDANVSAVEAISSLHGGMLTGPRGLSIPTIIP